MHAERQLLKAKKIFEDVYRDTKTNTSDGKQFSMSFDGMVARKFYDTKQKQLFVNDLDNFYDIEILDDGEYNIVNTIPIIGNEELIKDLQRERREYANSNTKSNSANTDTSRSFGEFNGGDNATTQEQSWAGFVDEVLKRIESEGLNGSINSEKSTRDSQGDNRIEQKNETPNNGVFFDEKTQFSLSDNKGRTLTSEQQAYFKDSKMRDKNQKELIHMDNLKKIIIL